MEESEYLLCGNRKFSNSFTCSNVESLHLTNGVGDKDKTVFSPNVKGVVSVHCTAYSKGGKIKAFFKRTTETKKIVKNL